MGGAPIAGQWWGWRGCAISQEDHISFPWRMTVYEGVQTELGKWDPIVTKKVVGLWDNMSTVMKTEEQIPKMARKLQIEERTAQSYSDWGPWGNNNWIMKFLGRICYEPWKNRKKNRRSKHNKHDLWQLLFPTWSHLKSNMSCPDLKQSSCTQMQTCTS